VEDTTEFFTLISKSLSLSLLHSHLTEGEKYNNFGWLFDLFIASSCGFTKISKIKELLVFGIYLAKRLRELLLLKSGVHT
jgi:hypothetical protein